MGGVFILNPHGLVREPNPVIPVRATANDHWYVQAGFTALSREGHFIPAHFPHQTLIRLWHEEVKGEFILIGEQDVVIAILIDIDKAQTRVSSFRIHNACASWE